MSGKYLPFGMYQFNLFSKRSSVTIPFIIKIVFMNFRYAQFNFTNVHIDFTNAQINLTYAQSNFTSKSNTVTTSRYSLLERGYRHRTSLAELACLRGSEYSARKIEELKELSSVPRKIANGWTYSPAGFLYDNLFKIDRL